jgi:FkbM family methyltransferase
MTEIERACQIVSQRENPTILELGAHHGWDTRPIYDAAQNPRYIAVEADPRNVPVLTHAVYGRKVTIIWAAVTDHSGEINFHLCNGNNNASSSVRSPKVHLDCWPEITFTQDVKVPCLTLNEIAARYGLDRIDLLWSDIQGSERDMISAGDQVLAFVDYLLMESDQAEMYEGQATRATIESLLPGFQLIDEWPSDGNVLFRNRRLG